MSFITYHPVQFNADAQIEALADAIIRIQKRQRADAADAERKLAERRAEKEETVESSTDSG